MGFFHFFDEIVKKVAYRHCGERVDFSLFAFLRVLATVSTWVILTIPDKNAIFGQNEGWSRPAGGPIFDHFFDPFFELFWPISPSFAPYT